MDVNFLVSGKNCSVMEIIAHNYFVYIYIYISTPTNEWDSLIPDENELHIILSLSKATGIMGQIL